MLVSKNGEWEAGEDCDEPGNQTRLISTAVSDSRQGQAFRDEDFTGKPKGYVKGQEKIAEIPRYYRYLGRPPLKTLLHLTPQCGGHSPCVRNLCPLACDASRMRHPGVSMLQVLLPHFSNSLIISLSGTVNQSPSH
jgi:hypothetical protein